MANFFMIVHDPQTTNSSALHSYIKNNPDFTGWWHYLSSAYIIKTNLSLADVNDQLQKHWPYNRHLIIKVDASVRNGWMTKEAWEWFHSRVDK